MLQTRTFAGVGGGGGSLPRASWKSEANRFPFKDCFRTVSRLGTEDTRLSNACNSDPVCPPKCRCESNVVDCSNLKLTKIPEHIPSSTNEL